MRYINMDPLLIKYGGRNAVKISETDLKNKLFEITKNHEDYEEEYIDDSSLITDEDINLWALLEHKKIALDLSKINFNSENVYTSSNKTPRIDETVANLLGSHTLYNGLTFFGCMAGGDWETPLFFIIYYDGKNLRGYIPSYGNSINLDFKTAFGSEEENTDEFISKQLKKKKYQLHDDYDLSTLYCKDQNVDYDEIVVNWQAVQKDIESRIIIKY